MWNPLGDVAGRDDMIGIRLLMIKKVHGWLWTLTKVDIERITVAVFAEHVEIGWPQLLSAEEERRIRAQVGVVLDQPLRVGRDVQVRGFGDVWRHVLDKRFVFLGQFDSQFSLDALK